MFYVIIGIVFIIVIIVFYIIDRNESKKHQNDYEEKIRTICEDIKNNKNKTINELEIKIKDRERELEYKENEYKERSQQIQNQIDELNKQYAIQKENFTIEVLNIRESTNKKNEEIISSAARENEIKLQELKQQYSENKEKYLKEFINWQQDIETQKQNLLTELSFLKARQEKVIQRFKEDEKVRIEKDFYRMIIEEKDIEDIKKLKQIAENLNSPIILYKLIWENYYKNAFAAMCGRVLENNSKNGIYKITNIQNEKSYIGQTKQEFSSRWKTHVKRGLRAEPTTNNKLYSDMWLYGPENFTFEILVVCDPEELNEQERYYIDFYDSKNYGYNGTGGNK